MLKEFMYNKSFVRIITDNKGEPRFVVKDVCDNLGLKNTTKAIKSIDKDDLTISKATDSIGREQTFNLVNESGLYQLIFQSRKEEAKKFKKWVSKEVIPSIRKTGAYSLKKLTPAEMLLEQAKLNVETERRLLSIENKVQELEGKTQTSETDYYTISGYCAVKGIRKFPLSKAIILGKRCSKLSRQEDYEIGQIHDQKYGKVNTYHIDILEEILNS